MEGSISCIAFILTISVVFTSAVQDQLFCCGDEFIALNLSSRRCETDRHLLLPCDEIDSVLYHEVTETNFTYHVRDERRFFRVKDSGQLSPFCLGRTIINRTLVDKNLSVIFCTDEDSMSVRHQRLKFHQDIVDNLHYTNPDISLSTIACIFSGTLLAIVAVLYISLPQTEDIEEKCIFHVAVNQSIFYFGCASASVVLRTGFVEPHLGNYCVFFWYLFVFVELSSFMWCAILTYHLRKTFRKNLKLNEFKRFCQYFMIAYGVPALLVLLCNIHVQMNRYIHEDVLELTCNAQFDLISSYYGIFPLIIISMINLYLYLSLEKDIKNVQPNAPEFSVTSMERFTFRLSVNRKLFILLVLPWVVIALLGLPMAVIRSRLENFQALENLLGNLISGTYFLLCSEGVVMFYMLIISHRNL